MPSSQKTTNYNLNKWQSGDKPKRDDFNDDNQIIDTALQSKADEILGTWVPILSGADTAGNPVYGYRTGKYMKIGSLVFLSFEITLTNKGSMSGAIRITGLPFPVIMSGQGSLCNTYNYTLPSGSVLAGIVASREGYISLRKSSNIGTGNMLASEIADNLSVYTASIIYGTN